MNKRALNWIINGRVGMSSKTMWAYFMGCDYYQIEYPHDGSDFGRCYELLEAVPEWKKRLNGLKNLSPIWEKLVDNWDDLTKLYEDVKINNNLKSSFSLNCLIKKIIDLHK